MAKKRMFNTQIIDSDSFLDLPLSTQALYFHLNMRADDDGFINNAKMIQRMINCSDDDLKLLIAKNFIIPFDSGVVVVKHWLIHNTIQKDRYKPTVYSDEFALLDIKDNKSYTLCIQNGNILETQTRLDKTRLDKNVVRSSNDLMELLSADDIQTLYAMYIDAGRLIDEVQAQLDRRRTAIKVSALAYIKGYATNKEWQKK